MSESDEKLVAEWRRTSATTALEYSAVIARIGDDLADRLEAAIADLSKSRHDYLDLQYQLDAVTAERDALREALPMCHSHTDGDCVWERCPQNRDGEPMRSGRHCPLDLGLDEEGEREDFSSWALKRKVKYEAVTAERDRYLILKQFVSAVLRELGIIK